MKHLTENQVRKELCKYPYVKECDTEELFEFTRRLLRDYKGDQIILSSTAKSIIVHTRGSSVRASNSGSSGYDSGLITLHNIGNLGDHLNKDIQKSLVRYAETMKADGLYLQNLVDSMIIVIANKLTSKK
jgi:hypothetical protein